MSQKDLLWGIDLGGTKIEGVIMDPSSSTPAIHRLRKPTPAASGFQAVVAQIVSVVADLEVQSGLKRPGTIGIGTPGALDPTTMQMKNSNTTCLNGKALKEDLAAALGCELAMANDANCFALAESVLGSAKGASVVMGLILGTGVGGGIVVNGQVLPGMHGIAGEWGHNPLPGESHPCYCGRKGCVETVIAGPSLERYYREQGGEALRLPAIAQLAEQGDARAIKTLYRLREKFAVAIAAAINILDPDAIVIGGGVGNLPILYADETRQEILRHVFNSELRTRILPPILGDSAGVFGAALLAQH